ncbi:MAG TPA: large conductance mechanosensitive channel protein MscL [Chloroflexota bacterium]|nr:large conductance mechanosensitive channel protein MscL [Chloroflexota bacterium]
MRNMTSNLSEFKAFILRGNVVDLAVGVVIGLAFQAVVSAFVKDIITPIITIPGKTNFSDLSFTIGGGVFFYGDLINVLINFIVIAAVVFFFVVKPVNMLMSRRKVEAAPEPLTRECPFCLSKIPVAATRCAFCTSEVKVA